MVSPSLLGDHAPAVLWRSGDSPNARSCSWACQCIGCGFSNENSVLVLQKFAALYAAVR
jgi:hypothetical protein